MYLPFGLRMQCRVVRAIVSGSLLLLSTAAMFDMTGCGTRSESYNAAANANRASGNTNCRHKHDDQYHVELVAAGDRLFAE